MNYSLFKDTQRLHGNGVFDAVMEFAVQYLLVGVFAVLGLLLLARLRTDGFGRAVRDALWPGGALVLSYVSGLVAAAVHPEARPFTSHPAVHPLIAHHPGQAFPSDHSTAAVTVALVVLVFLSRRWHGPARRRGLDRVLPRVRRRSLPRRRPGLGPSLAHRGRPGACIQLPLRHGWAADGRSRTRRLLGAGRPLLGHSDPSSQPGSALPCHSRAIRGGTQVHRSAHLGTGQLPLTWRFEG